MSYRNIVDRQLPQRSKLKFIFLKKGINEAGESVASNVYVTQLPFYENIVINESRKNKYTYYTSFKDDDPQGEFAGAEHRNFRLEFNLNLQHLLQETSSGEENTKRKIFSNTYTKNQLNTKDFTKEELEDNNLIPFSEQLQKNYIQTLIPELFKANRARIDERSFIAKRLKVQKEIIKKAIKKTSSQNPAGTKEYEDKILKDVEVRLAVPLPKGYPVTFTGQPTAKVGYFERLGQAAINFGTTVGSTFTTLFDITFQGRPDQQSKILAMVNTLATGMIKPVIADFSFNSLTSFYSKTPSNFTIISAKPIKQIINSEDISGSFNSTKLTKLFNDYINSLQFSNGADIESNQEVIKVLDKIVFLTNLLRASVAPDKEDDNIGQAPLVILNHGILYQNVPCFITNYQININRDTPYDTDTLLPYNISVSLDMFESKKTAKQYFNLLSGENEERSESVRANRDQIGWESVIQKPFSIDLTKDEVIF